MSGDVLAFLAAVHDGDEQSAREAKGGPWRARPDGFHAGVWLESNEPVAPYGMGEEDPATGAAWYQIPARPHVAAHIARHDPQSVVARVEAERALVALHPRDGFNEHAMCRTCAVDIDWGADREGEWPCPTLRALAWGYRHRDGFDPAWAPEGAEVGT